MRPILSRAQSGVRENILFRPSGEVQRSTVRQEVETCLCNRGAAFAFQSDNKFIVQPVQRAAAHLDYTSLAAVGHSVKGSVGLFCARRAIEAARRLEELAAAQDPQAATGQSQVLVSELKLLARALRGEVSGRA